MGIYDRRKKCENASKKHHSSSLSTRKFFGRILSRKPSVPALHDLRVMRKSTAHFLIGFCSFLIVIFSDLLINPFLRKDFYSLCPAYFLLLLGLFAAYFLGTYSFSVIFYAVCGAIASGSTALQLVIITKGTLYLPICTFWAGYVLAFVFAGARGKAKRCKPPITLNEQWAMRKEQKCQERTKVPGIIVSIFHLGKDA